jgi:hypothetical protein
MLVIAEWKEFTLDELGLCQCVLREEELIFVWLEGILRVVVVGDIAIKRPGVNESRNPPQS